MNKSKSSVSLVFWSAASVFIVLVAIFGRDIMPHDPLETNYSAINMAPSLEYIMGTDHLGRCVFSRIICGTGTSVFSAFIIIAATTAIGTAIGITAGLCGGCVDAVIMKLVTIFQAFPSTVFAIAVAGILGSGIKNAVVAMIVIGWPEAARLSRSMTIKIKDSAYLKVAKLYGCGTGGIIVRHIFPNIRSLILVNATLDISGTMLTMASLSFLGLSAQPPTPEWGYMLNEGRKVFLTTPGRALFPGLAIFIVVVIFNRLGDCLEQRLGSGDIRLPFWTVIKNHIGGKNMKKVTAAILALLLFAGTFSGCAPKESEQTAPDREAESPEAVLPASKHLNISFNGPIETIDPAEQSWNATRIGVGERLFRLDDDMNVQPWLAEGFEVIDEHTWKFTLRDDVNFSNGKKMTGDAVKACLDRTIAASQRAVTMLDIASIEADGQVLTVTTSGVNAALPANMCDLVATILDVEEIEEKGIYVAGTGPFVVDEFVKDERLELVANRDYWGDAPKLDTISAIFYADGNAAAMALESGELDMCFQLPSENMFYFDGRDGYTVHKQLGSRSQIMIINFENELLSDVAVRRAITMSIDREGYAKNLNNGNSSAATAIFPVSYSYGKVPGLSYDVEAAKALLAEAGYADSDGNGILDKNGRELSFRLYTYGAHGALLPTYGEAIQAALGEVGIEIKLELMDFSQQDALLAAGDFDITLNSYIMAPIGDPQYFTNIMLKTGADYNYGHYSNPQVDALAEELSASFDKAEREALAMRIQELVVADCGFITLGHLRYTVVASNAVSGVNSHSTEYYLLDSNLDINK